jgi:hypothetical protein
MTFDLMGAASKTCDFIRNKTPNKTGLFRTEGFDVERLVWESDVCDADDWGDFTPFMAWYDVVNGGKKNIEWVGSQFDLLYARLKQKSGLYYPFSTGDKRAGQSNIFPAYPQNHLDLILGFNILYALLHEKKYLNEAVSICDAIAKHATSRSGFVYGAVIPALNLYYPKWGFLRHKSVVSGVFIEEFSNLFSLTGNGFYLDQAKKMAGAWTKTETFRKYGICQDHIMPFFNMKGSRICNLGKPNTNFANGLMRLYGVSGDKKLGETVKKNLEGLTRFKNGDNSYSAGVDAVTGKIQEKKILQTNNHMVMGTFLDAFEVLGKREYLGRAEDCMDFWLGQQHGTGLFPMVIGKKPGWNICNTDTHSDMITIMCRLYMNTRKSKYKKEIRKAMEAYKFFEKDGVMHKEVDITGKKVNNKGELKYMGGLLKGLMSSYTILNNIKKIDKGLLRLLMRDR